MFRYPTSFGIVLVPCDIWVSDGMATTVNCWAELAYAAGVRLKRVKRFPL
jgi:hypothetical protein